MTDPTTVREALIAEAIGEFPELIGRLEALTAGLGEACGTLQHAQASLRQEVEGFERRMTAITEHAKATTARYIATRADESAVQSIERQSRAMADAARVAFGVEIGATMQRLQAQLQPLIEERTGRWQRWLTHAAAATAGAAAAWVLVLYVVPR